MRILAFGLLAWVTVALPVSSSADLVVDDFEAQPESWGAGVSLIGDQVKQGRHSMRWEADENAHIARADIPHDWTQFRAISFWMFAERATGSKLIITFTSEDPETEGGDYFVHFGTVDWSGWRQFTLELDKLGRARQPAGWHRIEGLHLYTVGWGQEKPVPGTVLYLDDMKLLARTEEELAAIRERERRQKFGRVTRINEYEDLLELLSRGGDGLDNWGPLPDNTLAEDRCGLRQDWHGATLWSLSDDPEGKCGWGREYDVDVTEYQEMIIRVRPADGTTIATHLSIDGVPHSASRAGLHVTDLTVPLTHARLQSLALEISGPGREAEGGRLREATIQAIILRKPERPQLTAFGNLTRGVMLAWERPSWGASHYQLYRSQEKITPEGAGDAEVIRPGLPADMRVVCDFPPAPEEWHYAIAPFAGDEPQDPGPDLAVIAAGAEPPVIRRTNETITVDGDLDDWPDRSWLTISSDQVAAGEPPDSAADISGRVALCHDDEQLYVCADVTDDIVRHANSRAWEGDGLVVMLRFSPPRLGFPDQRYDLVLSYTSGTQGADEPRACILEDRMARYPADEKPPAPGRWAVAYRDAGYVLEAAIPLAVLRGFGFQPAVGGIALGVSLYDGDQTTGATARTCAVSWNQRTELYGPEEAAVVRWE